jgi:hypothetical protein
LSSTNDDSNLKLIRLFLRLRSPVATAIGAVFDFIPTVLPFLAPGKGTLTNRTDFVGQVGFADASWHRGRKMKE